MTIHHLHTEIYGLICSKLRLICEDIRSHRVRECLDETWDDELVAKGAKEFIKTMDMAQEFAKSLNKLTVKAKPVADKIVKKSEFDEAVAEFERLLKSL